MSANKRGRPRRDLDLDRIHPFRAEGWSYTEIALELGVGKSTLWYALNPVRKTFINSQEAKSRREGMEPQGREVDAVNAAPRPTSFPEDTIKRISSGPGAKQCCDRQR